MNFFKYLNIFSSTHETLCMMLMLLYSNLLPTFQNLSPHESTFAPIAFPHTTFPGSYLTTLWKDDYNAEALVASLLFFVVSRGRKGKSSK